MSCTTGVAMNVALRSKTASRATTHTGNQRPSYLIRMCDPGTLRHHRNQNAENREFRFLELTPSPAASSYHRPTRPSQFSEKIALPVTSPRVRRRLALPATTSRERKSPKIDKPVTLNGVFIRVHSCSFVAGSIYFSLQTADFAQSRPTSSFFRPGVPAPIPRRLFLSASTSVHRRPETVDLCTRIPYCLRFAKSPHRPRSPLMLDNLIPSAIPQAIAYYNVIHKYEAGQ
jgi:hypothetical protein